MRHKSNVLVEQGIITETKQMILRPFLCPTFLSRNVGIGYYSNLILYSVILFIEVHVSIAKSWNCRRLEWMKKDRVIKITM